MRILLTGAAGFIGFHAGLALLGRGHQVRGIDCLSPYYDLQLKHSRLEQLATHSGFTFENADIADASALAGAAGDQTWDAILHLAAQAGVRHALTDPDAYTRSNLVGQANILELARRIDGLHHLVYASSSSVYGNDTAPPFSENSCADRPVSYYGATKRAGELMAHSYSELFGIRATGIRFFTVYGPWGRPDMAYWLFTAAILNSEPVPVFGGGSLRRDFTWIGDIVPAIVSLVESPAAPGEGAPHRIYNLGNSHPSDVMTLIGLIEQAAGKKAIIEHRPGPPGDVRETFADISRAARDLDFQPSTPLEVGIPRFVTWFGEYSRRGK